MKTMKNLEKVYLGGGCFWCMEAVFKEAKGIASVKPGYAGGKIENPTYEEVCSGLTGHAEVVEVIFDKNAISFEKILEIFFAAHDPTTLNRQGSDIGTQYRSIILYTNEAQKHAAINYIKELEAKKVFKKTIVTELKPLKKFYPAEEYHHDYFRRNPYAQYCRVVIAPKVEKVRKLLINSN